MLNKDFAVFFNFYNLKGYCVFDVLPQSEEKKSCHGEKCYECWRSYIEQQEPGSGWISVEDKPIPYETFVLAGLFRSDNYFENRIIAVDINSRNIKNVDWDDDTTWEIDDYTHWRPLPEPPENKE